MSLRLRCERSRGPLPAFFFLTVYYGGEKRRKMGSTKQAWLDDKINQTMQGEPQCKNCAHWGRPSREAGDDLEIREMCGITGNWSTQDDRCGLFEKEKMMTEKTLDVTNMEQLEAKVSDVQVHGDPGLWVCIGKASSKEQGWMKSTKVMRISNLGVLVQVSTQQGDNVAEALAFIPGASLVEFEDGSFDILATSNLPFEE